MILPVTPQDIADAHARIAGHVRRTPVWTREVGPGDGLGYSGRLSFKCEFMQHTGSFKPRGAFNTLLSEPFAVSGVAAASGGNHGAAVAYACRALGLPATIFVPEIASPAKIALIRRYGAEVVIGGPRYADALFACGMHIARTGAMSVHAYDSEATIAGQGSVGLEWEADCPGLHTILVAVGGGGLIAGIAAWFDKRVRVVGVEPVGARTLHASFEARRPVDVEIASIAADSLGARNTGALVYEICANRVDHVTLVTDTAIADAQRRLWQDYRIAVEPGGATAYAALLSGAYRPAEGENVGVLLCGANVDLAALAALCDS